MNATIDQDGTLVITATDWIEAYALDAWLRESVVPVYGCPSIPESDYIKSGRILVHKPPKEQA
jgi:hypothetical protein